MPSRPKPGSGSPSAAKQGRATRPVSTSAADARVFDDDMNISTVERRPHSMPSAARARICISFVMCLFGVNCNENTTRYASWRRRGTVEAGRNRALAGDRERTCERTAPERLVAERALDAQLDDRAFEIARGPAGHALGRRAGAGEVTVADE